MTNPTSPDTEIKEIREAMVVLCQAAENADTYRVGRPWRVWTMDQLDALGPFEGETIDLLDNPVGRACRAALHVLGQRLNVIGGYDAMMAACEDVGGSNLYWGDMIDAAFDGIGRWVR